MSDPDKKVSIIGGRPNYSRDQKVNSLDNSLIAGIPSRRKVVQPDSNQTKPSNEVTKITDSSSGLPEDASPENSAKNQALSSSPANLAPEKTTKPETANPVESGGNGTTGTASSRDKETIDAAKTADSTETLALSDRSNKAALVDKKGTTNPPLLPTGLAETPPEELLPERSPSAPIPLIIDRARLAKAVSLVKRTKDSAGKFQRVDYPKTMRFRLATMESLLSGAATEEGKSISHRDILLTALDRLFKEFEKIFACPLPKDKIEAVERRSALAGSPVLEELRGTVKEITEERDVKPLGVKIPMEYYTKLQAVITLLDNQITQRTLLVQATGEFLKVLERELTRKG